MAASPTPSHRLPFHRLPAPLPLSPADEDISAALEVERLSADDPIAMLSSDPDRFFGRTTKAGQAAPTFCTALLLCRLEDLQSLPRAAAALFTQCCRTFPTLGILFSPAARLLSCRPWMFRWRARCRQPRRAAPAAPTWDCELLSTAAAPALALTVHCTASCLLGAIPTSPLPPAPPCRLWGMLGPGILAILAGIGLVAVGCRKSRTCQQWRGAAARRLSTTRLAPRAAQYARYAGSSGGGAGSP